MTQIQFQGMIHDFVGVNSIDQSNTTRAGMAVSAHWINKQNKL
ncbi:MULTISPECIES: hypothetical protein [unclassified Enterococcus]|nr:MULTISPECIES: hypothetical protein [unclassified Enterococcus]